MKVHSFGSVWDIMDKNSIETANYKLRATLMMEIEKYINQSGLTQIEAAKKLKTTEAHLSNVMNGKIDECSMDRLIDMLEAAGLSVSLTVANSA